MARYFAEIFKRDKAPVSRCGAGNTDGLRVSLAGHRSGVTARAIRRSSNDTDVFSVVFDGGTSGNPNHDFAISYWRSKEDDKPTMLFDAKLLAAVDWAQLFENHPDFADKMRDVLFVNMHLLSPPGEK